MEGGGIVRGWRYRARRREMARECGNQGVAEERWALVAMVVGPVAERVMTSVLRRSRVSERKVVSGEVCGEKSGEWVDSKVRINA